MSKKSTPKTTNPKDLIGSDKLPMHLWPASATAFGVLGLLEGQLKYGRTNWRATPVRASVYYDALQRHMSYWLEGQDLSSDASNLHLGNALACLAIIVDAGTNGTLVDDRNYTESGNGEEFQALVDRLTPMVTALKKQFKGKTPKNYSRQDS